MLKIIVALGIAVLIVWGVFLTPSTKVIEIDQVTDENVLNSSITTKRSTKTIQKNNTLPEFLQNSSLKGTMIDGLYPVDENGNLVLDESIKNRFEYFLSTMGEFDLDDVKQMITDDIHLNLQDPARSQALKLFEDYIAYKFALAELENSLQSPNDYELADIQYMRLRIQQLRDKRREYFNQETVDAFFGFDEVYDDFMLNRLEIQGNSQLTQAEKQAQIQSLEYALPEDVRKMREETEKVSKVFAITEDMRKQGESSEAIYQVNAQQFGEAAAQRLQVVNEQRQQWEAKVQNYLLQKQAIENNTISDQEKQQQLSSLLEVFSENEQRRLMAYELMQQENQ